VFLVDDATIFRAMKNAGNWGGLICMRENGIVINEIIKHALAEGKPRQYHALTRPTKAKPKASTARSRLRKWLRLRSTSFI
jgi:hypothetical protein